MSCAGREDFAFGFGAAATKTMTAEGDRIAEEHTRIIDTLFVAAALASTIRVAECTLHPSVNGLESCNLQRPECVCSRDGIYLHTLMN